MNTSSPRIGYARISTLGQALDARLQALKDKRAHLAATEQPVDTSTATGEVFGDMLGVFAEFEANQRRERQAESIAAAKRRGVYRGRPPRTDMEVMQEHLANGYPRRKSRGPSASPAGLSTKPKH